MTVLHDVIVDNGEVFELVEHYDEMGGSRLLWQQDLGGGFYMSWEA